MIRFDMTFDDTLRDGSSQIVNNYCIKFSPGAIMGDGDRKRALILLLGLSP